MTNRICVGDKVNVLQNQLAELGDTGDLHIVHHVSDDQKTVYVRTVTCATKPEITSYTLRANGKYVAKGKKSSTWNATYLDVVACGM